MNQGFYRNYVTPSHKIIWRRLDKTIINKDTGMEVANTRVPNGTRGPKGTLADEGSYRESQVGMAAAVWGHGHSQSQVTQWQPVGEIAAETSLPFFPQAFQGPFPWPIQLAMRGLRGMTAVIGASQHRGRNGHWEGQEKIASRNSLSFKDDKTGENKCETVLYSVYISSQEHSHEWNSFSKIRAMLRISLFSNIKIKTNLPKSGCIMKWLEPKCSLAKIKPTVANVQVVNYISFISCWYLTKSRNEDTKPKKGKHFYLILQTKTKIFFSPQMIFKLNVSFVRKWILA